MSGDRVAYELLMGQGLQVLDQICSGLIRRVEKRPQTTLWHYTNAAGFEGIVREKSIRMTNIRFLNDAEEFVYCINLFRETARNYATLHPEPEAQQLISRLLKYIDIASPDYVPACYVCSFSEAENDLSQWRAYGGTGQGFSIGFNGAEFLKPDFNCSVKLYKCEYDFDAQTRFAAEAIGSLIMTFLRHGPQGQTVTSEMRDHCADVLVERFFVKHMGDIVAIFKNSAFSAEEEWRLVLFDTDPPGLGFLPKPDTLAPFVPLRRKSEGEDSQLPIGRLFVGPGPHSGINALSAHFLLKQYAPNCAMPEQSRIPHRVMNR